tara:strand:- start:157 stop:1443 length:1287 start_codon:yes stop_codon:yes gene_type:complete
MEAPSPAPIAHIIVNAEEIQEKYVMNFKKEEDGIHGFVICPVTNIKYLTMIIENSDFWKESRGYFQNDFQKFYTILEGIQSSKSDIKWIVVSKNEDKLSLKIFHTHTIFGFEVIINFNREHNKIDLLERKIKTLESQNTLMKKQLMKYEPSNHMWLTLKEGVFPSQIQYKVENGSIKWIDERFVTILPGIQKYLHSNENKYVDAKPGRDIIETETYNEIKNIIRKMCSEKGFSSFLLLTGHDYFQLTPNKKTNGYYEKHKGFHVLFLEEDWESCLKSLQFPEGVSLNSPQNNLDSEFRRTLNFEYHISVPFDGIGENICEPKKIIFPEYVTTSDPKMYYDPNYNDKKYHGITDFTKIPKSSDEGNRFPSSCMQTNHWIPGTFSNKRQYCTDKSDYYHVYQQKYINIPHFLYCSNCIEDNGGNYVCQGH